MEENKEEKALVGRPKKFKSAEEMQKKIDEYFQSCMTIKTDKYGNFMVDAMGNFILEQIKPFTMSGLANALDLSRRGLLNYNRDDEYYDIIEKAKRKCEMYAEERLFDKDGVRGAMFSLSNNYEQWANKAELGGKIGVGTIEEYIKEVEGESEY